MVYLRYSDHVHASEHIDIILRVAEDPDFDPEFGVLVDLSDLDGMPDGEELSSLGSMAGAMRDAFRNRIAVVVNGGAQRAFVSFLALYTMTWRVKISAFDDADEALAWLGAAPD